MTRKTMTLAERVTTPEFKADVARHAVKLEAEQAGWVVLDPKTHRALRSVARAAGALATYLQTEVPGDEWMPVDDRLARAYVRLERLSAPGVSRQGSTVQSDRKQRANSETKPRRGTR